MVKDLTCVEQGRGFKSFRVIMWVSSWHIYLTTTWPDLSYPVGVISQFMVQRIEEHLQCAQGVLRYVTSTKDRGLLYRIYTVEELVGYTCHDDTHIMTRKELNPRPCSTHVKSLTIVLIFLYV